MPSFGQLTETVSLGSDKKGSNPFYRGELLSVTKKEEDSIHDITISIDIKLNRSNKGIEVRFDKENGTPIYQDSEE